VQLAQFEEPAPDPANEFDAQEDMQSVVVERDEPVDSMAQVPPMPETSELPASDDLPVPQPAEEPNNQFGEFPDETPQFQSQPMETPERTPVEFQPALPQDSGLGEPPPDDVPTASEDVIEVERQKAAAACSQSLANLRTKTIDQVVLSIAVTGNEGVDFPFECAIDQGEWHPGRAWEQTTYLWKASALCHKPLYFEDEQLERYGHSFAPCAQPFISGAHFFGTLPVLPYCMGVSPPLECEYALGHYRPNSCAPYMINPVPISARGALIQAGAVAGTAAALP
jgi:hypothetical protein